MRLVTFTSDFGPFDEFVGVCHAVIATIAPDVRVIDFAHGLRGVRAVSAALAQSVPYAPRRSVHLCVADPGVGTARLGVAVATSDGSVLVGPDNGVLVPAAEMLGGVEAAHELAGERYRLATVSNTFHGRDLFAPAAAYLASGAASAADLGPPVPELVRLSDPYVAVSSGAIEADVVRADWYGNVQLAAGADALWEPGTRVEVDGRPASVVRTFGDLEEGALGVVADASGYVSVIVNRADAYAALGRPQRLRIVRG